MKATVRGITRLRPLQSAVWTSSCTRNYVQINRRRTPLFLIPSIQGERFLCVDAGASVITQDPSLDWKNEANSLLQTQVGTWDSQTWRKACRTFHRSCAASSQYQEDSMRLFMALLLRLVHERPRSSEAATLMNSLLEFVRLEGAISTPGLSIHNCIQECLERGWKADQSTYNFLIEIACQQRNPAHAEQWLTRMQNEAVENSLLRPDRYMYTAVVQAWVRSGSSHAAVRIEKLIRDLQRRYRDGHEALKPTESCYVGWIVALRTSDKAADAPEKAERILMELCENAVRDDFYPSAVLYNAVIHAWARHGNASRAHTLLHHMCRSYLEGANKFCLPDTSSFSTVILAWSKSGLAEAPQQAEKLLQQMQDFYQSTGSETIQPNTQTLTSVLDCWAKSNHKRAPQRAEMILRRMQEHYDAGNRHVEPNTVTFNACMNAWARSAADDAPERVGVLFRNMQRRFLSGDVNLKPCPISYMARINAWERSKRLNAAEQAQAVLDEMIALKDPRIAPTTLHFNRVILSWARRGEALQAEALLQQMIDNCDNENIQQTLPNLSSFNFLLSAWSKSGSDVAMEKVEETLLRMSNLAVRPDTTSFNTVLGCCTRYPGHFVKARSVLDLQIARFTDGDQGCRPDVYGYTSVIECCATEPGSMKNRKKAFSMALATFEQLKLYDEPNHVTFGAMLKACSNLLPSTSPRRLKLVDLIFQQCCQAGCVNNSVLYHLRATTTPNIYKDLLQGHSKHSLPGKWTFNLLNRSTRSRQLGYR